MNNISAKIIADSISESGIRMTTMEIEYPRFILAELNTHRMLSKNSASSRAIPVIKMHNHIHSNPAMPVYWGKNQPGMSAKEEIEDVKTAKVIWNAALKSAIRYSQDLLNLGVHKQTANRLTEAGMTMKTVISGTEWANMLYLRNHPAAQPEFKELAEHITSAFSNSKAKLLKPGEWHLPYISTKYVNGSMQYYTGEDTVLDLNEAKIVSASCCAQVSYRNNDGSLEKARKIYKQLIESAPAHASPVEHQATPMPRRFQYEEFTHTTDWPLGVSHRDRHGEYWSGNIKGWIQMRKLIHGEAVW